MSYESEMEALRKEEVKRGTEILQKYKNAAPSGVLDNPEKTRDFHELMKYIRKKRNAIAKKYGKK